MIRKQSIAVWAVLSLMSVVPVRAATAPAKTAEPTLQRVSSADSGPVETVTKAPMALQPAFSAEPSPPANIAYQALRAVVITRPGAKRARISLGESSTLRVGARVEYLRNGLQIATGRVVELNIGDALATIEPEAADHYVTVNTDVRIIENPVKNMGSTEAEKANKEYSKFEKQFAISAAIATAVYYAFIQ